MSEVSGTQPEPPQVDAIAGEFVTEHSTTTVGGRSRCTSRRFRPKPLCLPVMVR
jgi:hypothetical protein